MHLPTLLLATSLLAQAPTGPRIDASRGPVLEPPRDPLPHMRWDKTVVCASLAPTRAVPSGEFRLQCDDAQRVCLVSPVRELDDEGVETREPLARTLPCTYLNVDWAQRAAEGWRFVPAVAEAAPGWYRDERGRVMQFNFDLNRRVHLGGAWAPVWLRDESGLRSRYRADVGVAIEFPGDERDILYRIHLLEGEFFLGADHHARVRLFSYDWNRQRGRPIARITTFIGKPARFDLNLNLGGYIEALRWETLRRAGNTESNLLLATAQPTFDLWHSRDLVSYLRLRAGPGLNLDTRREALQLVVQAALEGDVTVDEDGFHHLRLVTQAEKRFFGPDVPLRARDPQALRLRLEYEVIVIAINDQPLSLVLDGRGTWRDDLVGVPAGWEWSAGAGLRFSLWAPARRDAPVVDRL